MEESKTLCKPKRQEKGQVSAIISYKRMTLLVHGKKKRMCLVIGLRNDATLLRLAHEEVSKFDEDVASADGDGDAVIMVVAAGTAVVDMRDAQE